MCGIAGLKRMGDKPILKHELEALLTSLEYRGNDASGIAIQQRDGKIAILKDDKAAWKFIVDSKWKDFIKEHLTDESETVLLHTRAATKGTPHVNKNNHPLSSGAGCAVHNGMISNDDFLFSDLKLERGAETDSDIIRAIIDKEGITKKAIERLNRLSGTCAAACIHPDFPGRLLLLRSCNPLVFADTGDKIYFASDKRAIYNAAKPWVWRHKILMQIPAPALSFVDLYEDSAWLLDREGLDFHGEFKTLNGFGRGYLRYDAWSKDYHERQKRFAKEAESKSDSRKSGKVVNISAADDLLPALVYCPNRECFNEDKQPTLIELTLSNRRKKLFELQCARCETNLSQNGGKRAASNSDAN